MSVWYTSPGGDSANQDRGQSALREGGPIPVGSPLRWSWTVVAMRWVIQRVTKKANLSLGRGMRLNSQMSEVRSSGREERWWTECVPGSNLLRNISKPPKWLRFHSFLDILYFFSFGRHVRPQRRPPLHCSCAGRATPLPLDVDVACGCDWVLMTGRHIVHCGWGECCFSSRRSWWFDDVWWKKGFDGQQHLARILSLFLTSAGQGTNACRPFGVLSGTELRKTIEHAF